MFSAMSCTRRQMLYTIGAGVAATALGGCGGGDGDTGVPAGTAAMCGPDLCFKISENPELQMVGGIVVFDQAAGRKIFVQRTSDTEFLALSAICTHAGCTVEFNGSNRFNCPCHGSSYDIEGKVINGPAQRPLDDFPTAVAGDDVTISLT